jgi:hypothetical protein
MAMELVILDRVGCDLFSEERHIPLLLVRRSARCLGGIVQKNWTVEAVFQALDVRRARDLHRLASALESQ